MARLVSLIGGNGYGTMVTSPPLLVSLSTCAGEPWTVTLPPLDASALIEVLVALSILFLAVELAKARQYGIARRHEFRGGRWYDMWFGEVLRDEWLEGQVANGASA